MMKLRAVVVGVLSLAMAMMAPSCLRHTKTTEIEFGKITQGDRIEWSVSFGEPRVPTYQGGNNTEAIVEEMMKQPALFSLSASGETDVWTADHFGRAIYHFDGSKWSEAGNVDAWVNSIYASDPNHVWVGAEETAVDEQGEKEGTGRDIILFFDGKEWTQQLFFDEGEYGSGITDIGGSGPNNVWAIGDHALFHYDSRQWSTVYAKGDGGPFDRDHPDLVLGRLLVDRDGIPIIYTNEGFFYYQDDSWNALPELPKEGKPFNCRGLTGSLREGIWASGPIEELSVGGMYNKGVVFHYRNGRWELAYKNEEGLLGSCSAITPSTVVVAGNTSKEAAYGIDMKVAVIFFFDGSSWSEQGSIDGGTIWGIDIVDENTIWLTDGERVLRGEIKN